MTASGGRTRPPRCSAIRVLSFTSCCLRGGILFRYSFMAGQRFLQRPLLRLPSGVSHSEVVSLIFRGHISTYVRCGLYFFSVLFVTIGCSHGCRKSPSRVSVVAERHGHPRPCKRKWPSYAGRDERSEPFGDHIGTRRCLSIHREGRQKYVF